MPDDGIQRDSESIVRTALSDSLERAKCDIDVVTVRVADAIHDHAGRVVDVLTA